MGAAGALAGSPAPIVRTILGDPGLSALITPWWWRQTRAMTEPAAVTPPAYYPGKTLGIVGLVLAFLMSLPAIVVSAVALHESRLAGVRNPFALAGLIVSIIFTALGIIAAIVAIVVTFTVLGSCVDWTPGAHMLQQGNLWRCYP